MTDGGVYVAVTLLVLMSSLVLRPHAGRCPDRWHNEGVRRDGSYSCRRDTADGPFQPGEIFGVIYCNDRDRPVVVDQRTIMCRMVP